MKKVLSLIMAIIMSITMLVFPANATLKDHTYYSQYGWVNNSSLCYCACIAMTLTSLGNAVTPLDIYKFNGNTAYCKAFTTIASNYGATYHDVNIDNLSASQKEAKIKELLQQCPQGVIVYGGGHMVLARKVENGTVYFDDPAHKDGWQAGGCCIPISHCNKVEWDNISLVGYFSKSGAMNVPNNEPSLTLSISSYPTGILDEGDSYPLRGTITSNYNITSVTGSILNSSGKTVMSHTQNPNTTNFNIRGSAVDMNLKFGSLSPGNYTLKFTAKNSAGTTKNWSQSFTVAGETAPKTYTITFDARGGSVSPSSVTLTVGQSYKNLPTPTYPGFEFVGWYIDTKTQYGNATTLVRDIGAFKLTEDATIYAEWREAQPEHVACTTHTKGAFQFYEASHPHYNYYKCSVCGETFTDGSTSYMESCATCNPPKESTVTPWSGWSTTPVQATATRQVETRTVKVSDAKTQYRYGRYVSNGHDCWCATYLQKLGYGQGGLDYSEWTTTRYSTSGKDWSCGYCNGNHQYVDHTSSNGTDWWKEYKSPSGQSYYWEETQTVPAVYETQYRYRDRVN